MFNRLKKIYDNIKNINSAVSKYESDSVIQSLPTIAYVNKAKKLIETGNYDAAIKILKAAIDISEKDFLAHKYLGKIYEINKDFAQAIYYYEKSALYNPNDKEIWLRLGMSYLYSDKLEHAIKCYTKADKISPSNTDVYTGWGMALMKQKRYSLARDKFNIASKLNKYNFTAILLSAVMEIRLKEYSVADEKLSFLVKVSPNEGSLYEYAHLKLLQKKYQEAELYAKRTIELNKLMMPAYLLLGEIYSIKQDYTNTQNIFLEALNNDLENDVLQFEWGKACVRLLDFEGAKSHFKMALDKNPQNIDAKIGLILTDAYDGKFELLKEYKENYSQNVYIQEACGLEQMSQCNYEKAIEYFKKAIKTDSLQTYIYYDLACAYIGLQNNYKVRESFDKFLQENPKYFKGYIDYSKWLINMSDYEDAKRKLTRAQSIKPDDSELLNMLFYTYYTLVKKNICEYNIKVAIEVAKRASALGNFQYPQLYQELEQMLENLQIMS